MATTKPPILRYRASNPNTLLLQLWRANQHVVPTDDLALKLEIRSDPKGRVLTEIILLQPSPEITTLTASLPNLDAATYYVDIRLEQQGQPVWRSGLCLLEILPIGSLELLRDIVGLTATIDESTTLLYVELDASPSAALEQLAQQRLDDLVALITDGFLPYQIDTGQLYIIPDKRQALSAMRIRLDGRIRVSGRLIFLS